MGKAKVGPKGGVYVITVSGNKRYLNVNTQFCGPAGGAKASAFPVTTEKECRAALSYARYAPDPQGIRSCALKKAAKHGWRCGVTPPKKTKSSSSSCGCS